MSKHHLIWNESHHSVGIALIDNQHREMIERVNQVADGVAKRDHGDALQEMLESIILFAIEHFAFEEQLMVEHGFPGKDKHIEEHFRLVQQLNKLIEEYLYTPTKNKALLASAFLTDWAEQHILQADKELGEFLCANGLS